LGGFPPGPALHEGPNKGTGWDSMCQKKKSSRLGGIWKVLPGKKIIYTKGVVEVKRADERGGAFLRRRKECEEKTHVLTCGPGGA